jgi:hypothetical protein
MEISGKEAAVQSGPPSGHLNHFPKDFIDPFPHRIKPVGCVHDKIGAFALFGVGNCRAESHRACPASYSPRQNPLALNRGLS